jgi:hypothetical protein
MAKNIFLGALPDYDGGYRDTADGSEGTIKYYDATKATSSVNSGTGSGVQQDVLRSPAYYEPVKPAPIPPADGTTSDKSGSGSSAEGDGSGIVANPPADTNTGGDADGGSSKMIYLVGAAAIIYFFFLRKKK